MKVHPRASIYAVRGALIGLFSLTSALTACSTYPEGDPIAHQMRTGGASCAEAAETSPALLPATMANAAPAPRHLALQGQMSIKLSAFGDQPAKGLSVGFFFSGDADSGQLDLMTLMGSQMARVDWQAGQAWLTNDKGRQRYASLDELSEAALGEAIPLRQLVYWMLGQPDPTLPSTPAAEPDAFIQQGWLIDAHEYNVKKLQARREALPGQRGVQLKIYLDR